jgi:hypothetical protein
MRTLLAFNRSAANLIDQSIPGMYRRATSKITGALGGTRGRPAALASPLGKL